ncbi:TonB family protein [Pseudomonas gingeri]|uniref:TonB family protein n=1 Tax=Pseudomonas gingeri TaxID=117681 RepID=A0A7Y7XCE9_9PSED|nr:TonB family protein [Pseudomonas gingeri]
MCSILVIGGHGTLAGLLLQRSIDNEPVPPPAPPVVMQWVAPPISTPVPAAPEPQPKPESPTATPASPRPSKPAPKPAAKKSTPIPQMRPEKLAVDQPSKVVTTAEPKAPVSAAQNAPEQQVVGPYGRAGYLNNPPPAYPPVAARLRQEGVVTLRVHVQANGRPTEIQVFKSSGFDALDQSAVKAVNQWTFMPAKRGEVAIDGWVNVPLAFKLSN